MGSFEYSTIDFENVTDVRLVGGSITNSETPNGESTSAPSSESVTKEQQRKRQLIEFRRDEFEEFDDLFTEFMTVWEALSPDDSEWPLEISRITGVPDYVRCRNCEYYGEGASTDGKDLCFASGEEQDDGETYYRIVEDNGSELPNFCETSMRRRGVKFPTQLLFDLPPDVFKPAWRDAKGDIEREARRHIEGRETALDEGRNSSKYVTEPICAWVETREVYAARNVMSEVDSLFIPSSYKLFRSAALEFAWRRTVDDVLTEDYHRSRAEAYLRALDSPVAEDTKPGEGGLEFERDVREFVDNLGWPLRDRVFEIETETGQSIRKKEVDIHTEIDSTPALIEVYTHGAHREKDRQLADYRELYQRATGTDPITIEVSDRISHAELSLSIFETLVNLNCSSHGMPPGDYYGTFTPSYDTDRDIVGQLGADDYTYQIGDGEYTPPRSCIETERAVEHALREQGSKSTKPYSKPREFQGERDRPTRFGCHAIGPTVPLVYGDDDDVLLVAFHGGRASAGAESATNTSTVPVTRPIRWTRWLSRAFSTDSVNVVRVHDEPDGRNALSPRLLAALLMI